MEEIIKQLWRASDERRECRIVREGEPFPRVIQPYGVCQTSRGKIMVVGKQTAGFTKAGREAGYRNLDLGRIQEVEILDSEFAVDPDFNPDDPQYKEWIYHI
ncbi:MAG: WYL domain-containing protein [Bacteroidota bacterium]